MSNIFFIFKPIIHISGLFFIYYNIGYEKNIYAGYNQIIINWHSFFILILFSIFYYEYFKKKLYKPSDFFIFIYTIIVFFPYIIFNGIWGRTGLDYIIDTAMLFLPILSILTIRKINFKIVNICLIKEYIIIYILIVFTMLVIAYLLNNSPYSASLSLSDSYIRRIEARQIYGNKNLINYLSSITMNGILPLLAYLGAIRKQNYLILYALISFVFFYYIYGVKAPLLYIITSYIFGYFILNYSLDKFIKFIFILILISFFISLLEFYTFDYSYIEDYLIRRIFYVGNYLLGAYFSFFDDANPNYSQLTGIHISTSASMFIGQVYLGKENLNANTNTFLFYLIQFGILGYLASILLVSLILTFFDKISKKNKLFMFLSFIFSILILEQSFTVTLLSSGIGVLSILFIFVIPNESQGKTQ